MRARPSLTSSDTSAPTYHLRPMLGRLWRGYLRPHKLTLAVAFGLMVIEGSTLGILSYSLQPMFDRVLVGRDADFVWVIGGLILGLFLLRAVSGVAQRVLLTRVAQKTSSTMQGDLVAHLMRLDSVFFQKNPPGSLMERVQGDTQAVQNVWQQLIQGAGRDLIALVALAVVAITIDPGWTLAALIGIPLLILPSMVLQRYVRRKTKELRETASHRSTRLDEIFHGINPIKLNQMEDYQTRRFRAIVARIVRADIKSAAARASLPGLIDVITGVGFFAVLILGGTDIISGEKTVGQFMSFFTAMALAFQPLRRLANLAGVLQVAAASLERLFALFDTDATILSPAKPAPLPQSHRVDLKDVRFSYDDTPVLNGLSFTAAEGQTTALVGASGAGKSTVFNLLTRLIVPQSGDVMLGGTDIGELDLSALRRQFSVVTQDALLFDETLRENILLGKSDVDEVALERALEASHMADFLPNLADGLNSPAGPRGSNLSGGQRQRVAIARALLNDAPVLLLDEATSALDAKSEAAVQSAIDKLAHGRTTLVIAHRLSTIRNAHKIVVMDKGRVVDEGTHEELLARGGIYSGLYQLQFQDS